jgi:hypothetical protein
MRSTSPNIVPGVQPPSEWSFAPSSLLTRWAHEITPNNVWPEYLRPQMARGDWHIDSHR